MDDDRTPGSGRRDAGQEPRETVTFGTEPRRGRLARWLHDRSPRQTSTLLVGSTALLGVVVLVTVVGSDRAPKRDPSDGRPATDPSVGASSTETSAVEVDRGRRVWIGFDGVMVSVPRSWADRESRCAISETSAKHQATRAHCGRGSTSTSLRWVHPPSRFDPVEGTSTITGMRIGEARRAGPRFVQSVGLRSGKTVVVISTDSRKELIRLVGSAQPIPTDRVSVPDLVGSEPSASLRLVADLGLQPRVNHNSGTVLPPDTVVVDQNPTPGRVVAAGTEVWFSVLPAGGPG